MCHYNSIHEVVKFLAVAKMESVTIIGQIIWPRETKIRVMLIEGLVSIYVDDQASPQLLPGVARLNEEGIRTHLRKADHYLSTTTRAPASW